MPLTQIEIQEILTFFEEARGRRHFWDDHWQDIADLVRPSYFFERILSPGNQNHHHIYDSTAPNAAEDLAGALHGLLTNPSIRWMSAVAADPAVRDGREESAWSYHATEVMLQLFASNQTMFATAIHSAYLDQVTFGTTVLEMTDNARGIKFTTRSLNESYLGADDNEDVIDVYRVVEMSPREMAAKFGQENLSERSRQALRHPPDMDRRIEVLHAVMKRRNRDPYKIDNTNKPIASVYLEIETKHVLREGGFDEMPLLAARWSLAPNERYGRSPAMRALPDIQTANTIARQILVMGAKAAEPPLLMPSNMIDGQVDTRPGGIIWVRAGSRDQPRALDTRANPAIGQALLEQKQAAIERAFYNDRFNLPENDRMTATEIVARRQENLLAASPVLSRQYAELLIPMCRFVLRRALRRGWIMPPPETIARGGVSFDFLGPLALSQKQAEVQGFTQGLMAAQGLVQVDPMTVRNLDSDYAFRDIMLRHNIDPRYLRPEDEVARERQQQEQAAAMSSGAATARDAGAAAKDFSQAMGS